VSSYYEEDDPVRHTFDAALWRRMTAHALPYRKALSRLALAGLLVAGCDVLLPRITGSLVNHAIAGQRTEVWTYAGLYLGVVSVLAFMVWYFIRQAGIVATGVAYDLRRAAFGKLQELSFSFYDHRPVGWLMARLTTDCDRISSVLPWTLLDAVWGVFFFTGAAAMMLWMN